MELAGFQVSPAERLRVFRVVEGFGKDNLQAPEKLKYLLCPIIAQGQADQEKFYELFDQYWVQMEEPWEMPIEAKKPIRPVRNLDWLKWLVLALAVVGLAYMGYMTYRTVPDPMSVHFTHPSRVAMGETVRFENNSANFDSLSTFRWEISDAESGEVEFIETDSFHLHYEINQAGNTPFKKVKLISINPAKGDTTYHESQFTILCGEMPVFDNLETDKSAKPNEPLAFKVSLENGTGVDLSWDMGDAPAGEEPVLKKGNVVEHGYEKEGLYQIRLRAVRGGVDGYCQIDTVFNVKIGGEKAYLTAKTLYKDDISSIVNFSIGMWVLMGIMGLGLFWFLLKWATRKPPLPEKKEDELDLAAAAQRFKSHDKAPYKIPFRSHNAVVRADQDLYRLADVMRQRQEGLRKEMDVPSSVKKTIAEGGFPHLLTKRDTVPTEYLFLIEEQTEVSHQRHLNEWVVSFLQQREVLGEVFYFKNGLQRFWNGQFPDGITADQLRRLHGFHKLVVLSSGHGLIDASQTFERQRPQLHPVAKDLFGHWKQRLLLTPVPVVSWTFREGVLHNLFAIFPMDTVGLNSLLKYLEQEVLDEERPPYSAWSSRLLENRSETDINYLKWRTAADHQEYLRDHPNLYKWLGALAVYPTPRWDMTLAIGRALSEEEVDVTYDNLLMLCRIPWLISGELSPRLRHQLLDDLDPPAEKLAREAVEKELSAIQHIVKDGHANLEHQVNLALQQFALTPEKGESQIAINQLMALNLLAPRHFIEINQSIDRFTDSRVKAKRMPPTANRDPKAIQDFIEENKPAPEQLKKPFFTRDFWLALVFAWLFIMLFTAGWNLGGTDTLAEWAGVDTSESTDCVEEHFYAYILKKECMADSSVFLNNRAVSIFENMAKDATAATQPLLREVNQMNMDLADSLFEKAIDLRPNYDLPKINREKLGFNLGVDEYHAFLADSSDVIGLQKAIAYFQKIQTDSLLVDALHGEGLSYFELEKDPEYANGFKLEILDEVESIRQQYNKEIIEGGEPEDGPRAKRFMAELADLGKRLEIVNRELGDSSQVVYEEMLGRDSSYFKLLPTYPHLQLLLSEGALFQPQEVEIYVMDASNRRTMKGVLVTDGDLRVRTNANGKVTVAMKVGERRTFDFSINGYEKKKHEIRPTEGGLVFNVAMIPMPPPPPEIVDIPEIDEPDLRMSFKIVDAETGSTINGASAKLVVRGTNQELASSFIDRGGQANLRLKAPLFNRHRLKLDMVIETEGYVPFSVSLAEAEGLIKKNRGKILLESEEKAGSDAGLDTLLFEPSPKRSMLVLDKKTKTPIGGVEVLLYGSLVQQRPPVTVVSDGKGQVNMEGEAGQANVATISYPGYESLQIDDLGSYLSENENTVLLSKTGGYGAFEQIEANMVFVKGGTFQMGCDPERDGECRENELPLHEVLLDDYYIGKYEVTNEEFAVFLNENRSDKVIGGQYDGKEIIRIGESRIMAVTDKLGTEYVAEGAYKNHPVVSVTWFGAIAYCHWLSQATGNSYRLPTEAEWEYAARGGNRSKGYEYSGSNTIADVAWYNKNANSTYPVGLKQQNELGLYDMSGNVWEWCRDGYGGYPSSSQANPSGSFNPTSRVNRGGNWYVPLTYLRCSGRSNYKQENRLNSIGFRLVRENPSFRK